MSETLVFDALARLSQAETFDQKERWHRLAPWLRGFVMDPLRDADTAALESAFHMKPAMLTWAAQTTLSPYLDGPKHFFELLIGYRKAQTMIVPKVIGHVWANTLPTSGWGPVLACLFWGSKVIIKVPKGARAGAEWFKNSLTRFSPEMSAYVEIVSWDRGNDHDVHLASGVGGLIVSGGAQAIARFEQLCTLHKTRFVGFGPGQSVAVISASSDKDQDTADALAIDIAAYEQLGCLSPAAVYVEGDEGTALEFGRKLGQSLKARAITFPVVDLPQDVAATRMMRKGSAEFTGEVLLDAPAGLLLYEPEGFAGSACGFRTIGIHLYSGGTTGLKTALRRDGFSRLHAIGWAGEPESRIEATQVLEAFEPSRICPLGTMQTPPLGWHHDGLAWPAYLLRFIDLD